MAKALNPLSVAEGKLGNVVYFKLKNSADGQRQGEREYVANPANPQTDSQLGQRCKMTTVTNCYRTFRTVIQRAFEGTEYGQRSYQRWASLAMSRQFAGPWVLKGDRRPCPVIGVPMSIGSLPQVSVEWDDGNLALVTSLVCTPGFNSVGELSQGLLNGNDWLQADDQITICAISGGSLTQNLYFGGHYSFYLNVNDTSRIPTLVGLTLTDSGNYLALESDSWQPMAACVIISREGSHLRSTSYWGYSPNFAKAYILDGDTDVLPSYRSGVTQRASDWPVDPGAAVPVGAFLGVNADGGAVLLQDLRIDGDYLVATASNPDTGVSYGEVYFKGVGVHDIHYNRWLTSFNTDSSTAPTGVTAAETIQYVVGSDATPAQVALLNWLIANGVDERWLYVGS